MSGLTSRQGIYALIKYCIMKTIIIKPALAVWGILLMTSCSQQHETGSSTHTENTPAAHHQTLTGGISAEQPYKVGDHIPANQVCMVNNAYMAKDQFEVPFEGKTYYGCCQMCVERIPKDEAARIAVDQFTSEKVDKALAYIVLSGENGEVAYFSNEDTYRLSAE